MANFCGSCGNRLNPTAIFCGGCGTRVPVAAPAPPPAMSTPAPSTEPSGFTSVPAAFAPAAVTPDAAGFATVPSAFPPPSVSNPSEFSNVAADSMPAAVVSPVSGFTSVSDQWTPATPLAPSASEFATVPAASAPVPVIPADPGFTSVPVNAPVDLPPAPVLSPSDFVSVPVASTPTPAISADPGFTSIPVAYTPPQASNPVTFTPNPAAPPSPGYAPVSGAPVANQFGANQFGGNPAPAYAPPAGYAPPSGYAPMPAAGMPAAAYPAKKSNTLLKVILAFVVLIFVGGALALAGLWYAAQKIKAKAHAITAEVMGESAPSSTNASGVLPASSAAGGQRDGIAGDPCRFLSTAEVSQAIGIPIIRAEVHESGCNYIAKGDPAEMTAKHMSSMLSGLGADAETQKIAQKFAGAVFSQQQATDKGAATEAAEGELPVLTLLFTSGHAATWMKLNRGAFGDKEPSAAAEAREGTAASRATSNLPGIGDEAFVAGGSAIMLRKGNVMARMMYTGCPCNTDNIKPLAQALAARL